MNGFKAKFLSITLGLVFSFSSCKKFVEIGTPAGSVDASTVYNEEASAIAGVTSLYSTNANAGNLMLSGTLYDGLYADELNLLGALGPLSDFQNSALTAANNLYLANALWGSAYTPIINANIAISSLEKSTGITPFLRDQLIGEAKFWRAHSFFMLTNTFGAVPLSISTNVRINAELPRASSNDVYNQILIDLRDAKTLLTPSYPSDQRARVSQYAVSALLARVYLYRKDWANAEAEASDVIDSKVYSMSAPEQTFINTSNETILQLYNLAGSTQWSNNLVPASQTNFTYHLAPGFTNAFEPNDKRFTNWVAPIGTSGQFSVNKYKLRVAVGGNEYYVMLRLAEQYLIRAEARAQQGKLGPAIADLNVIRSRAGLLDKSGLSKQQILLAIEQERKVELFGEYPHRWFDLRRTPSLTDSNKTRADDILAPIKAGWKSTNILFPVSDAEIIKNPNLLPQNPGY